MAGDFVKILYGTTNKAKLQAMHDAVKNLDINIIGLSDIKSEIPKVNECGKTPLENAEIKAKAYYEAFKIPVFSCDSGLYFDELEDEEQPGIYVRRVNGKELSDDEMIEYYSSLAKRYGGKISGQYYYNLDLKDVSSSVDNGIKAFFEEVLSKINKK